MSNVFNWQLGRDMDFPYEAAYPNHQFAFVFNLNRCIGCQSCTMACKSTWTFSRGQESMWWNNVETKPYGGYPHHWDVKILDLLERANPGGQTWDNKAGGKQGLYGKFNGKTIFETAKTNISPEGAQKALGYLPTDEEWSAPNRYEDHPAGSEKGVKGQYFKGGEVLPSHKTWFFYLARICNHCSYPACLAACPRNAIYKRPEDGIVLIDQDGSVKFSKAGKPVVKVAKDISDNVKLVRENFVAGLQTYANTVFNENGEAYKAQITKAVEAGKPIQRHDKEKLDEAMEKLVEQAIAEAEKAEPQTEVPTQERELVPA